MEIQYGNAIWKYIMAMQYVAVLFTFALLVSSLHFMAFVGIQLVFCHLEVPGSIPSTRLSEGDRD